MRITRDKLLKFAEAAVMQRVHNDRHLVCVYLTGSLLDSEPLLGGSTDIDLIFVHDSEPAAPREITRINNEVTLDIANISQQVFHHPRRLRQDPWWGSFLCENPVALHDNQHWFEFTQASVCAQFNLSENINSRARPMAESARQRWAGLSLAPVFTPPKVLEYLCSLKEAANTLACLSGPPLTLRRFMLKFPSRVEALGRPGMAEGLADLFTTDSSPAQAPVFAAWNEALAAVGMQSSCPPNLLPCRAGYFHGAAEALWTEEYPAAAWIILNTWVRALCALGDPQNLRPAWEESCRYFGLSADLFEKRIEELDAYLDSVEETLDMWGFKNGVLSK